MEETNCLICNSDESKNFIEIKDRFSPYDKYQLMKCSCGFIYLNPRPTKSEIKEFYKHETYLPHANQKSFTSFIYKKIQLITLRWKYKLLLKYSHNCKNCLDIGGGVGEFVDYLSQKNIHSVNFDPNVTNAISSLNQLIEGGANYNIITFWHSLEHIHDLNNVLRQSITLLDDKGKFLIAVPNHDATERVFFREKWIAYDVPRHLYHFNYKTMKELLQKHNIKIIATHRMYQDTIFNIIYSIKSYNIFKITYIILKSFLSIIFNKKSSSSLLFICRKS